MRAALNPFASTIGYIFPFIVSGSIIVSLVLGLPTVGPLLFKALDRSGPLFGGNNPTPVGNPHCHWHLDLRPTLNVDRPRIRFGMEGSR